MNTELVYMYRDGSNYKISRGVIVKGWVGPLEEFVKHTSKEDQGQFLPGQVGLTPLQINLVGFPNSDDHVWHELLEINQTEKKPTKVDISAKKLFQAMKRACKQGWNVRAEMKRAGIPE